MKRAPVVVLAEKALEQMIRMDSVYLKVNVESNQNIHTIRRTYEGRPWKRLRLFSRFPRNERPLVQEVLSQIAQETSPFEAELSEPLRAYKKRERTVGFGATSDTLLHIHQKLESRLRPVMEDKWKEWPGAHRHLTENNWSYSPLMIIEFAKKWSGSEKKADRTLRDLLQICKHGTGNVTIEGFVIREMTRKDLTPGGLKQDDGSIEIPFTGPILSHPEVLPSLNSGSEGS